MQYFLYNFGTPINFDDLINNLEKDSIYNPELISYEYPIDIVKKSKIEYLLTKKIGYISLENSNFNFVKFNNLNKPLICDCNQVLKLSIFISLIDCDFILNCTISTANTINGHVNYENENNYFNTIILKQFVLDKQNSDCSQKKLLLDIRDYANMYLNCKKLF